MSIRYSVFSSICESILAFVTLLLQIIALSTSWWASFTARTDLGKPEENGHYGLWTLCSTKGPHWKEDCDPLDTFFEAPPYSLVSLILAGFHILILALFIPLGILRTLQVVKNSANYCIKRKKISIIQVSILLCSELRLGDNCKSSYECLYHLHHSICDWTRRVCICQPHHFQFNETWCLPASLLGYSCTMDAQCQIIVKNSECSEDKICLCKENYTQLRNDRCLPPVKVDDYCLNDRQCEMASKFSYCKYIIPRVYGKCQCTLGFRISEDGHCFPHLGGHCKTDDDCLVTTPNSQCQEQEKSLKCQCTAGFKPSSNQMTCEVDQELEVFPASMPVQPVSLGKPCLSSSQCRARDPRSECIEGNCECVRKSVTCSSSHTQCLNDTYQCTNGQCISWFFVCDGESHCLDNSDEEFCVPFNCPKASFKCDDGTCMSRSAVCNGRWECPDGSDEARCYTGIPCDRNSFRCKNGQCLPLYVFCNIEVDCSDGSDEDISVCERQESCPADSFLCNNGRCQSTAILCSGYDGCGDNSDEDGCDVCFFFLAILVPTFACIGEHDKKEYLVVKGWSFWIQVFIIFLDVTTFALCITELIKFLKFERQQQVDPEGKRAETYGNPSFDADSPEIRRSRNHSNGAIAYTESSGHPYAMNPTSGENSKNPSSQGKPKKTEKDAFQTLTYENDCYLESSPSAGRRQLSTLY